MNYIKANRPNRFDNLVINVSALYKIYPLNSFKKNRDSKSRLKLLSSLYNCPLLPLNVRSLIWYLLHRIGIDIDWFDTFKKYWRQILGGITLWSPHDFYFLRNIYRLRFQYAKIPDTKDPKEHLKMWQQPEILYQLLDMVFRESLYNLVPALQLYFQYRQDDTAPILEFGCGTAPVTTSLLDFTSSKIKIYISDLETVFFHYAAFKFRFQTNVVLLPLVPEKKFMPEVPEKVGAIFCMTVFEHLDRPLEVAKQFYKILRPGGLLIFDYIKSEGKGMDTVIGLKERNAVLDFIKKNFQIVYGVIEDSSEARIIVAKKC